ncbi:hypothetical protein [Pedobacter nyackensis]|uniref:hypothetical protein n=1 Tax=Pedobacter nyackensis TaxID=475255 RepID=UPI0029315E3D|nr:hypothetical protein [Pedobacter nyackensis]
MEKDTATRIVLIVPEGMSEYLKSKKSEFENRVTIRKARKRERKAIALKLKAEKVSLETISTATGLTVEEIEVL